MCISTELGMGINKTIVVPIPLSISFHGFHSIPYKISLGSKTRFGSALRITTIAKQQLFAIVAVVFVLVTNLLILFGNAIKKNCRCPKLFQKPPHRIEPAECEMMSTKQAVMGAQ